MNAIDIRKNVLDLEYNHILNIQGIVFGFIAAFIISVSFISDLPDGWPDKMEVIVLLIFISLIFFNYFNKKLESITRKILELQKSIHL